MEYFPFTGGEHFDGTDIDAWIEACVAQSTTADCKNVRYYTDTGSFSNKITDTDGLIHIGTCENIVTVRLTNNMYTAYCSKPISLDVARQQSERSSDPFYEDEYTFRRITVQKFDREAALRAYIVLCTLYDADPYYVYRHSSDTLQNAILQKLECEMNPPTKQTFWGTESTPR